MSAELTPEPYGSTAHLPYPPQTRVDTLHGVAPARAPLDTIRMLPGSGPVIRYGPSPRAALRKKTRAHVQSPVSPSSVRFRGLPAEQHHAFSPRSFLTSSAQMAPFVTGTADLSSPWAPTRRAPHRLDLRRVLLLLAVAAAGFVAVNQLAPFVTG